jgi:hypothetical protein
MEKLGSLRPRRQPDPGPPMRLVQERPGECLRRLIRGTQGAAIGRYASGAGRGRYAPLHVLARWYRELEKSKAVSLFFGFRPLARDPPRPPLRSLHWDQPQHRSAMAPQFSLRRHTTSSHQELNSQIEGITSANPTASRLGRSSRGWKQLATR